MVANPLKLAKRIYVGRVRTQNEIDRFLGTRLLEKVYGYAIFCKIKYYGVNVSPLFICRSHSDCRWSCQL